MRAMIQVGIGCSVLVVAGALPCRASGQSVGVKVGGSHVTITRADTPYDPFGAWITGAFVTYPISQLWSLRADILLGVKGGELERPLQSGLRSVERVSMGFVEMPLLVEFTPLSASRLAPYIFAGPGVAIRGQCSISVSAQGPSITEPNWFSEPCGSDAGGGAPRYATRALEVGLYGGAGVRLGRGRVSAFTEVQMNRGASSLQPGSNDAVLSKRWSGLVGVVWRLGN